MRRVALLQLAVASASTLAIAGAAQAQTAAAAPVAVPEAQSAVADIVVTAQKRSEKLINVPIAITAVNASKLGQNNITITQQLGQVVPGLRLDTSGAFSQPTLRGVGSSLSGAGYSASIATYVDGVYHPSELSNSFELADIDSVQVLKGPQGTLFGRNATGGAILVTTLDPSFTPTVKGGVSYGRYNETRETLTASTGLTKTLAVGVSGYYHRSDGFTTNIATGKDAGSFENWGVTSKLLFKPSSNFSYMITYEHFLTNDDSVNTYTSYQGRNYANDPANLAGSGYTSVPILTKRGEVSYNAPTMYHVRNDNIIGRGKIDLGFATLTSYTAYLDEKAHLQQDYDATVLSGFAGKFAPLERTYSQELNLASNPGGKLNWVAGLYYFHDFNHYPYYNALFGSFAVNAFDAAVTTRSMAAFADATYDVSDKLHLTFGARYSDDKLSEFFTATPSANPDYTRAHKSFHSFTPRGVIRYSLTDRSNVYVSYNKGYKSGAFNATAFSTTPAKPESIDAYEVGYKISTPRFSFDAAGYYYNFSNLQVTQAQGTSSILVNAAKARIYGIDGQASARVTDHLTFDIGGAWIHARYRKFLGAPAYAGTGLPGDPIRYVSGGVDASGNTLLRAPTFSGSVAATYTTPLADGNLRVYASYYRTSKFYFDPAHNAEQKAYGLLNARIGWTAPGDHYTVSVYGNNLTNTTYLNQVLAEAPYAILQTYGAPRTYGVEVNFKF